MLLIAVDALNNTANPKVSIPTRLVLGTVLKIPSGNISHLSPNQKERFQAMESVRQQIEAIIAKQRLTEASKSKIKSMEIFDFPPASEVLVYRERRRSGRVPIF